MFALASNWRPDLDLETPIAESRYSYSSTITVYDEQGSKHDVTIYYDRVANDSTTSSGASGSSSQSIANAGTDSFWEYIVTVNPADDKRTFGGGASGGGTAVKGTASAGLLMMGTMRFNSSGQMIDMSSFTPDTTFTPGALDLTDWRATPFSANGLPMFAPNFSGQANRSSLWDDSGYENWTNAERTRIIDLDFGIYNKQSPPIWTPGTSTYASQVGSDANNVPSFAKVAYGTQTSTSYSTDSGTLFMDQNGYTSGFLQNIYVDRDGIITGRYSNGAELQLYQTVLYDFRNKVGLFREGGNLFSQTIASGERQFGKANTLGLGAVNSNSLEMSNVDLAREFVDMITTQRGFSANGKVITTTDQMLSEVIMLKR